MARQGIVLVASAAALLATTAHAALAAGKTQRVSVNSAEQPANRDSYGATISGNGRYVAFYSDADNLVTGDTNGVSDILVRDRKAGTTMRVSLSSAGAQADAESIEPHISRDGRYVVFGSRATNLVPNVDDGSLQIYRRDLVAGTTALVSVATDGGPAHAQADQLYVMAISGDGRYVAWLLSGFGVVGLR